MAFLAKDLQSSPFLPRNCPRHNVGHKQLGGGKIYYISQVTVHHLGKSNWDPEAGTWRQELEQKLQRNTACVPPWLVQLSIFYTGWLVPHLSAIFQEYHQLKFLFPDDASLCQVDKN